MSMLFYLTHEQMARIKPSFPLSHGGQRLDGRCIISGIISVIK